MGDDKDVAGLGSICDSVHVLSVLLSDEINDFIASIGHFLC